MIVNMHEAKTQLSKLTERFLEGEEVVVARNGKPVFKFAPIAPADPGARTTGFFGCDIDMSKFDEALDGMEEYL